MRMNCANRIFRNVIVRLVVPVDRESSRLTAQSPIERADSRFVYETLAGSFRFRFVGLIGLETERMIHIAFAGIGYLG